MNASRLFTFLCLALFCRCALTSGLDEQPAKIRTVFSSDSKVCRKVSQILSALPRYRSWNGTWREEFDSAEWKKGYFVFIDAHGTAYRNEYLYAQTDINNDGRREVAIKRTSTLSSQDYDFLYIGPESDWEKTSKEGHTEPPLDRMKWLNQGLIVKTSSGEEINPAEMQIWRFNGKNYIVMKDLHFLSRRSRPSVYVTELRGDIDTSSNNPKDAKFSIHMICRFKEK